MTRRRNQKPGDIVSIDIGDGRKFYAVALTHPLYAFLDGLIEPGEPADVVRSRDILFKLWATDGAVKTGRWPIIGKLDVHTVSAWDGAVFFKQDKISGRITAYERGCGIKTEISIEEANQLECAAVWSAEHIEDRLRDHSDAVPNKWWASMRPQQLR